MKTKKLLIGLLVGALLFNSTNINALAEQATETETTVAYTAMDAAATETKLLKATNTETTQNSADATQTILEEATTLTQDVTVDENTIDEAKLAKEQEAKAAVEAKAAKEAAEAKAAAKAKAAKAAKAKVAKAKAAELKKKKSAEYKKQVKYLAALIYTEAGNQSYKGKVAVANVVLNRADSKKVKTEDILDVIHAPNQFSVVRNGSFKSAVNNYSSFDSTNEKECIKAAKAALDGKNYVGNRKYFTRYTRTLAKQHSSGMKIEDHYFW